MANPDLVKGAIKQLIYDNQSDLVDSLSFADYDLDIGEITRSALTVAVASHIHIAVVIPRYSERTDARVPGGSSIAYAQAKKTTLAEYEVEIHVTIEASRSPGEATENYLQPFETAQIAFDTFMSRLINLFRDNETIPPESGSFTIELLPKDGSANDRRVDAESRTGFYEGDGGDRFGVLYDILRFRIGTCGEPDPLP